MKNENYTIALLIDTDNVSAKYINALMQELFILGKVTYRRMYGDFTQSSNDGWKRVVNKYAITPVQQYTYTVGKNATDSRMVIDAMDILYSDNVDAFCIMSSDSDFTGIAKRLKESNKFVIGAGERKTPNSFVNCCDRFFILEDICNKAGKKNISQSQGTSNNNAAINKKVNKPTTTSAAAPAKESQICKDKEQLTASSEEEENTVTRENIEEFAIKIMEDATKPVELALVIQKIYQAYPQFNFKNFGYKKAIDFFDKNKFTFTKGKTTERFITLK